MLEWYTHYSGHPCEARVHAARIIPPIPHHSHTPHSRRATSTAPPRFCFLLRGNDTLGGLDGPRTGAGGWGHTHRSLPNASAATMVFERIVQHVGLPLRRNTTTTKQSTACPPSLSDFPRLQVAATHSRCSDTYFRPLSARCLGCRSRHR